MRWNRQHLPGAVLGASLALGACHQDECEGRCADPAAAPDLATPALATATDLAPPPRGRPLWAKRLGGAEADAIAGVAADGGGNVLVVGSFRGKMDLGGEPLVSAGGTDVFLAKLSADGAPLWSRRFGGARDDAGLAVAVDREGNVIVGGSFYETVDLGGGPLVSAGGADGFVARLTPAGAHVWSRRFGAAGGDSVERVAVDEGGNVVFAGEFFDTVSFGGAALGSAGLADVFVARYGPDGNHLRSWRAGGAGGDFVGGLAVSGGGVLLAGYFNGTASFGGGALTSAGAQDVFLASYGLDGSPIWSRRFGAAGDDRAYGLAVDAGGNASFVGYFQRTVDFGGGGLVARGVSDLFVARYNALGVHLWSRASGGAGTNAARHVAASPGGEVLVCGSFEGTADLGGGGLVSAGATDLFAARYAPDGRHLWSARFGGPSNDDPAAVTFDGSGGAIIGGTFAGAADFGAAVLTSAGGIDGFVLKLAP